MKETYLNKKGLTVKNLVTIGIFSALFLIFSLVGGVFFAINPILTFYMPIGCALLCGPIYCLMVAKVQKRWAITILGIIMCIVYFVTGMHWALAVGYLVMGIIADIVAGLGKYKDIKINLLSYMLLSLGATGSYIVFFINPTKWMTAMLAKGTEQTYLDTMQANAHSWMLAVIIIGTLVMAFISGLIGQKMLRKQFEKAGIVQ